MKTILIILFLFSVSNISFSQTNLNNQNLLIEQREAGIIFYNDNNIIKKTKKNEIGFKKGYKGVMTFGYQIGASIYENDRLKFDFINSFQFNPYLSLGIGIGYRNYLRDEFIYLPLFFDIRVNLIDNDISPFIALGTGALLQTEEESGEGVFYNPSFGVSFISNDNKAIHFGLGFDTQKIRRINDYTNNEQEIVHNAFEIFMGVSF